MLTYQFRIYVTGQSGRGQVAVANLRALCAARLPDQEIEVVDVLEHPALAEEDRILATPTVIRLAPLPRRRVIGDLSDHGAASVALDLPAPPHPDQEGTHR